MTHRPRRCSVCRKPCQATGGTCQTCLRANAKRRTRQCPTCGVTTTAKGGICRPCRNARYDTVVTEEHALTGGSWRQRGLVQIWEPDHEELDAA